MTTTYTELIDLIAEGLEIPPSAYKKAEERYQSIGKWLEKPTSCSSSHAPHVHSQGSFRLGTVVRPLNSNEEYDLDMSCRLEEGIQKYTHTQKQLKELIGNDLKEYRNAHGISEPLGEKRRCWRLEYADDMNFHIDVVPAIPET